MQSCNNGTRFKNARRKVLCKENSTSGYVSIHEPCRVRSGATTKIGQVILDFDMVSEIITFEQKGRLGKEKHQNFGVKVKVVA